MQMTNQAYSDYIDSLSPSSKLGTNCLRAFLMGGAICTVGEGIKRGLIHVGMIEKNAAAFTAIALIFIAALLTGLGVYSKLTKLGKAGSLIPITGFSNAVVSPAMEFRSEGHVAGTAVKLFSLAGPVLVFGTLAAAAYGVLYALVIAVR